MSQNFQPGDLLVFQLESGYALLRLLAIEETGGKKVWHLAAYDDLFPSVDEAETKAVDPGRLSVSRPHVALTNRAFESTQVAKLANVPLTSWELQAVTDWKNDPQREVSDRSVRLILGLR